MPATIPAEDDLFADLDALIQDTLTAKAEATEAAAARRRVVEGRQSATEQAADRQRIAEWEAKHEWRSAAITAIFNRYTCSCGAQHTIFGQLMLRQQHRSMRLTQRWVAMPCPAPALPKETLLQDHQVTLCTACAGAAGFALTQES